MSRYFLKFLAYFFFLHLIRFAIATSEQMMKFMLQMLCISYSFYTLRLYGDCCLEEKINFLAFSNKMDLINLALNLSLVMICWFG